MNPTQPSPTPSMFDDVGVFHTQVLNQPPRYPQLLSPEQVVARRLFMQEELNEFVECASVDDMVGMADALADLVYVALGTAYLMGLPFDDIWAAVQEANMRKVPGLTKRGMPNDAMKPEGWVGPEARIEAAIGDSLSSWQGP